MVEAAAILRLQHSCTRMCAGAGAEPRTLLLWPIPCGCPMASCPSPSGAQRAPTLQPQMVPGPQSHQSQPRPALGQLDSHGSHPALSWKEVGVGDCRAFSFRQSPASWEDWTPELLQVKNSKSNIFLVVFLYSN